MRCGYLWEGVVALLVWLLLGWSGGCVINICVEGVSCAEVLKGGGYASGIPSERGIWPHFIQHSPLRCRGGPGTTTEKSSRGPLRGPLGFCTPSSLMQASMQRSASVQKKPSSVA